MAERDNYRLLLQRTEMDKERGKREQIGRWAGLLSVTSIVERNLKSQFVCSCYCRKEDGK